MAILTLTDKAAYFPAVTAAPEAIEGLIILAQSICEGPLGANRPLELQPFTEVLTVSQSGWFAYLSRFPVTAITAVSVRRRPAIRLNPYGDTWGRPPTLEWISLNPEDYVLDGETGQLNFYSYASEAKVSYTSGFDFTAPDSQVQQIKAIAGLVLTHMANNKPGLDSYLSNPDVGTAESFNYARLDDYLGTLLLPLKKYVSRKFWS